MLLYLVVKTRRAPLPIGFCVGAVPALLALGLYNDHAFGSPLHLSYRYTVFGSQRSHGFFGLGAPSLHGLWETLFADKGLISRSPVMLLASAGLVLLWQTGKRAEAGLCVAVSLTFVVYNAGYFAPYGGTSPGPRFLVPALPFLALGLGHAYRRWPRIFIGTAVASLASMIQLSATWNEDHPWTFVTVWSHWAGLPRFAGGSIVCATALLAFGLALACARIAKLDGTWRTTLGSSASGQ